MTRTVRPHGSWPSPVTPERLVEGAAAPGEVAVDGDDIWWSEARPSEGGRTELVRRRLDGTREDVLAGRPAPEGRTWNARTALLEYGGGAWCVESGVVTFAQWDDQRLHGLAADDPDAMPVPLTPEPATARGLRYGDLVALDHGWLLAVREAHPGEAPAPAEASEAVHEIVAVPTDGSGAEDPSQIRVLVSGPDFVASPRPGPARLAWIRWDHPRMPWDGSELCVARLGRDADGTPVLRDAGTSLAGGPDESVVQPEWGPDGTLWFCGDGRDGWWNLHRILDPGGEGADAVAEVVAPVDAEVGGPRWVGGLRWYAPLADGRLLVSVTAHGTTGLALVTPPSPGSAALAPTVPAPASPGPSPAESAVSTGRSESPPLGPVDDPVVGAAGPATTSRDPLQAGGRGNLDDPPHSTALARVALELGGAPISVVGTVVAGPGPAQAVVIAASGRAEAAPVLLDLPPGAGSPVSDGGRGRTAIPSAAPIGALDVAATAGSRALRPDRDVGLGAEDIAVPEPISFPSADGRTAHAQLYRPESTTSMAPDGELPPLLVMIHGGPTTAARPMLELSRQFWTTRGIAVVDVDYGGSTGYGRPYRRLLDGAWGIVDVEDCVAAVRHLAAEGIIDGDRVAIRGGSAGGFTTLVALCTSDAFAAGTSFYGVTDLGALARDTHKFESRYLDGLVGPWPEEAEVYASRSPLGLLDGLATPVLVLQGTEDAVVPPAQAEAVVAAAADRGLDHEYLLFEGEGHGFRQATTIVAALRAELAFYGRILGFTPAPEDPPPPPSP